MKQRILLKWPNDLLLDDAKVCGVLVEARQQGQTGRVVVGCGLNLRPPKALDRQIGALPPAGLLNAGLQWSDQASEDLVAGIAMQLAADFGRFLQHGFGFFRERWQSANYFTDKTVELRRDDQGLVSGRCRGVDDSGALLIESAGIITGYSIGVVSARSAAGAAGQGPLPDQSAGQSG
jgi:BirA family biotin operon repressor/biotin-[acetyl-CoA-carboxylase] ligase